MGGAAAVTMAVAVAVFPLMMGLNPLTSHHHQLQPEAIIMLYKHIIGM